MLEPPERSRWLQTDGHWRLEVLLTSIMTERSWYRYAALRVREALWAGWIVGAVPAADAAARAAS